PSLPRIPGPEDPVPADRGQHPAVRGVRDRGDDRRRHVEDSSVAIARGVPEPHRSVVAGGCQGPAVGSELHPPQPILPLWDLAGGTGGHVPRSNDAKVIDGCQGSVIRREGHGLDTGPMTAERPQGLSTAGVPQPYRMIPARCGEGLAIVSEDDAEDRVL